MRKKNHPLDTDDSKKGKWRLRPFGVFMIFAFFASFGVILYGLSILNSVNHEIEDGANEALKAIKGDSMGSNDFQIRTNHEETPENAVAILTFLNDDNQRIGVFNGISDEVLSKGAGRDESSAFPNTVGNCVLYAHRDSAFSSLQRARENDCILLETKDSLCKYRITNIRITTPDDPTILHTSDSKMITLVTCYPFSYVGPAPKRCVVTAEAIIK